MNLISFDDISLINFEEVSDLGTGDAVTSNTPIQGGGSIDDYGSEQTFAGAKPRGNSAVIAKATAGNLALYLNQLKVRRGKRGRLGRLDANSESQFTYARLKEIRVRKTTDESRAVIKKIQSIALAFICDSDTWFGDINESWKINDGNKLNDNLVINGGDFVALTGSPQVYEVEITQDNLESKIDVRGPKFTITAPAGLSINSFKIENDRGGTLLFTGTVAQGKSVVIDCAASRVLNDGVDAYDDLTITYNPLSPYTFHAFLMGVNELTFTYDAGESVVIEWIEEHI